MSEFRKAWNVVVKVETKDPSKPFWHTIGRAWESERNPGSFKLKLNSIPFTSDVYLFPAVKRDKAEVVMDHISGRLDQEPPPEIDDDGIPF